MCCGHGPVSTAQLTSRDWISQTPSAVQRSSSRPHITNLHVSYSIVLFTGASVYKVHHVTLLVAVVESLWLVYTAVTSPCNCRSDALRPDCMLIFKAGTKYIKRTSTSSQEHLALPIKFRIMVGLMETGPDRHRRALVPKFCLNPQPRSTWQEILNTCHLI